MVFDVLGMSLFDFMQKNSFRAFPVEEVQHFAVQLAVAIEYMHSRRLTHTNLKPENIMIDNTQTLKVRTHAILKEAPGPATLLQHSFTAYHRPRARVIGWYSIELTCMRLFLCFKRSRTSDLRGR
jgi:serine/threonine protein kinase